MSLIVGQIRKSLPERTDTTLRKPSDSRSQEESAYSGYHLAYEVKKLMYASVVNATLYCDVIMRLPPPHGCLTVNMPLHVK